MSRITKSGTVNADPEKLTAYIGDARNNPAFVPAIKTIENVSGDTHKVGATWDWVYSMIGVELNGKSERTAFEPGKRVASKALTGIKATIEFTIKPEGKGSNLTMVVDYETPTKVLEKIMDKTLLERHNEKEVARTIENIQIIFSE